MKPSPGLSLDYIFNSIYQTYSGKLAKETVQQLYTHCRRITDNHYEAAMRLSCSRMESLGFSDVELLRFPIGPGRFYGNWKTPRCWNILRAYLDVEIKGKWVRFADYERIPTSIMLYAAPTHGEVKCDLVPSRSADSDYNGSLVFCDPTDEHLERIQTQRAKGIVTDFAPNWEGVRDDSDFRNGHRWDNGTLFEVTKPLAGFSLSRNQGDILRLAFKHQSRLKCRYRIDGKLGAGYFYCATGCIKGIRNPEEEVVMAAHLYEAGANDNCSGAAAAIESLRTIRDLVQQNKLGSPLRTIRVIFAFEIVGFLAYFESVRRQGRRYVAGVNPDMVGEDQAKCRSVLHVYQSPHSLATFSEPLLFHYLTKACSTKVKYALKNFIVNDNVISDPAIGVPCPALIHLRDRFYHSNEDTPDKVSTDTLKRVGSAMAAHVYAASVMDAALSVSTASICLEFLKQKLSSEELQGMSVAKRNYWHHLGLRRLVSLETLAGQRLNKARAMLASTMRRYKVVKKRSGALCALDKELAAGMVPVRTVLGPMTLEHIPPKKRKTLKFQPHWSGKWNLPIFWVDGKRSLLEIYHLAEFESGPYNLKEFIDYFEFLKSEKLIQIRYV